MLRFVCRAAGRVEATRERPGITISASSEAKFFIIEEHPLFAQDFFSTARRDDLFLPG
jgi:hypothetical protein